jgi:putative PIN family toxin of toxin-antitoxin system
VKALFDTNVLLAAFLTDGVCAKLLTRARKQQFDLIICPFILREFDRILTKKFSATKQERDNALALIAESSREIAEPSVELPGACRDKDDDNILACALEAEVDHLVTGDKDLLELKKFRGINIITPREFELLFED